MRLLSDPRFLSDMVGRAYDCVLSPDRWQAFFAEMGDLIGARHGMLGVVDAASQLPVGKVILHNADIGEVAKFSPLNPMIPLGLIWPLDHVIVASADYPEVYSSRFFREFSGPRGDGDVAAAVVTREASFFGHWALVTPAARGPITSEERAGLELLAPHVRRAVEIGNVLEHRQLTNDSYRRALDALNLAVLIVGNRRDLRYANPQAQAMLSAGRLLRERGNTIVGTSDQVERALRSIDRLPPGGGEFIVQASDGSEMLIFAVRLSQTAGLDIDAEAPTLLIVRSPRQATANTVAIAARLFDLTGSQVQVLAFLAQGHSVTDIADILGISTTTVRTHLGDLFRKTGTTRQGELIARTLSLGSPL